MKEQVKRVKSILGKHTNSHWGQRIIAGAKRGEFTIDDVEDAGLWPTCASGESDPRIPQLDDGQPTDRQLLMLGTAFSEHVFWNRFEEAAQTLVAIEQRAAEVIK